MKKLLIIITLIVATLFLVAGCTQTVEELPTKDSMEVPAEGHEDVDDMAETESEEDNMPNTEPKDLSSVKEFTMKAIQWDFQPSVITVNEGDTVKLAITSDDVTHGFRLSEFGVSESLKPGKTVNVEFLADKKGTFSFFCSVPCGSGHGQMKGTLIVE